MPGMTCVSLLSARFLSFVSAPIEERSVLTRPLVCCPLSLSGSGVQSVRVSPLMMCWSNILSFKLQQS